MTNLAPHAMPVPTEEEIFEYLKRTVQTEMGFTAAQLEAIRPEATIAEGLPLDSLAQTVLINRIESHFGIMFELEDWQQVCTIRDFACLIRQRIELKTPQ